MTVVKKTAKAERLSEIESAIYMKMSPELLVHFTKHAVKYKETTKLVCVDDHSGRWYEKKDLDAFNTYLRQAWPKAPTAQRPKLPGKIRNEIMLEASAVCPICGFESAGEAAHLEAISASHSHHPENLLWLCPNHHTVIDDVAQMSNVKMTVARAMKEALVDRKLRMLRHEHALDKGILDLLRLVEKATEMLANATLKEAHGGIEALASIDLKGLASVANAATAAKSGGNNEKPAPLETLAKKISTSAAKASVKNPSSLVSLKEEGNEARAEYLAATGRIVCPLCDGAGHHNHEDCPVCQCEGTIAKEDENKVDLADFAIIDCPVCEGSGRLRGDTCPACVGDARMERRYAERIDTEKYEMVDCPLCKGRGCYDGDQCPVCVGDRTIEARFADEVDPKDYDSVECRLCEGSGRFGGFECKPCGGEGRLPKRISDRIDWREFELVDCPSCDGTGAAEWGGDCRVCGGNRQIFQGEVDRI
ncbi:HNH endonuclease signature motif containing protein [Rhizobium laguerreae]|uniref:HNH endonuclease signature motif containing protein n=1 Tax=Rhizobium laguerreae TaxID=1076926 RepID=UPI001C907E5A|nr:HNH endonuclease signature motif containing protein [Rhizobium laguerreae]MBY3356030.1 hypothetical protein [Rhizobium laguerreae]MBY3455018.1 hypothetical protein [Rhizobium laguerreae]MBY3462187.1 hypothetical protein [Rhizobium laguerreae]